MKATLECRCLTKWNPNPTPWGSIVGFRFAGPQESWHLGKSQCHECSHRGILLEPCMVPGARQAPDRSCRMSTFRWHNRPGHTIERQEPALEQVYRMDVPEAPLWQGLPPEAISLCKCTCHRSKHPQNFFRSCIWTRFKNHIRNLVFFPNTHLLFWTFTAQLTYLPSSDFWLIPKIELYAPFPTVPDKEQGLRNSLRNEWESYNTSKDMTTPGIKLHFPQYSS